MENKTINLKLFGCNIRGTIVVDDKSDNVEDNQFIQKVYSSYKGKQIIEQLNNYKVRHNGNCVVDSTSKCTNYGDAYFYLWNNKTNTFIIVNNICVPELGNFWNIKEDTTINMRALLLRVLGIGVKVNGLSDEYKIKYIDSKCNKYVQEIEIKVDEEQAKNNYVIKQFEKENTAVMVTMFNGGIREDSTVFVDGISEEDAIKITKNGIAQEVNILSF